MVATGNVFYLMHLTRYVKLIFFKLDSKNFAVFPLILNKKSTATQGKIKKLVNSRLFVVELKLYFSMSLWVEFCYLLIFHRIWLICGQTKFAVFFFRKRISVRFVSPEVKSPQKQKSPIKSYFLDGRNWVFFP